MTTPNERGKRAEAIELLTHYFELCSRGEWKFDSDNAAEIETIIDDIITVAVSRAVYEALQSIPASNLADGRNGNDDHHNEVQARH